MAYKPSFSNYQKSTAAITLDGTDKTIYTTSVPFLGPGSVLHLNWGLIHSTGTGSVTYKIKWGATSVTLLASADTTEWNQETIIANDPGSQVIQKIIAYPLMYSGGTLFGTNISYTAGAENTNGATAVTLKLTANGANTEAITGRFWFVHEEY